MSIKQKKTGPRPAFPERWQQLATDPDRTVEAVDQLRKDSHNKIISLKVAWETVRDFQRKWGIIK